MRTFTLDRPAVLCRFLAFFVFLIAATPARAQEPVTITGVVVDQNGQPLPRVAVGVGHEIFNARGVFTDERGRFEMSFTPMVGCRLDASLAGFADASVPCGEKTIVMRVKPIEESVVVTATRTEAPASQVGASVSTFTEAQINARQTPLVADLLRSTPGAMVVRTGAPGAVTSLFVRGGESTYNKVLVDGIPLNEPGGTFFFNNLTTANLERIEVVRGAQSALFGSDAMASVVQLFTKRGAAERPTGTVTIEGGTFDTLRALGTISGRSGATDYAFGGGRYSTDNEVPNSAFDNRSFSLNVGRAIGHEAIVRVISRGEFGKNGVPGQTAFARPDLDAFAERDDGIIGVVFDQQVTATVRQRGLYSLAISNQQSTNLIADPPYTASFENRVAAFSSSDFLYDSRTKLRRHHASYQADVRITNDGRLGRQLFSVLADWDGERASLQDLRASTASQPSRDNAGVSAQYQAVWRRVMASGSARFEHNDSFGNAAVPRGSLVYVAHEGSTALGNTTLHLGAGLGIKEPTLLQSFSPSPFFKGNPDLEPERSRSIEAGIEQRLASDRARIAVTWFDNRFKNLISTRTTNPATFEAQYFNIGLTGARGAEFTAEVVPMPALRIGGGYTLLDSEIIESTSPTSPVLKPGQPLFRRPRHSGFAEIGWSEGRLSANLVGVFIGSFIDSDFSSLQPPMLENPGYTTWDARAAVTLTKAVAALVAVDNLADADYLEPLGYETLGRAVRIGVRVGF